MAKPAHSAGPPPGYGRFGTIDRVMVGLITFLASEVMLFGAFFTAFFYMRYSTPFYQHVATRRPRTSSRRTRPGSTRRS